MKKIALSEEGIETVYGARDANLKHIESLLNVEIRTQGGEITIEGDPPALDKVDRIVDQLSSLMRDGYKLSNADVKTAADLVAQDDAVDLRDHFLKGSLTSAGKRRVAPKTVNQRRYLDAIEQHDIVFGIGPAGTGKTYLAMAQAVSFLIAKIDIVFLRDEIRRGAHVGVGQLVAVAHQRRQLIDDAVDLVEGRRVAFHQQVVALRPDADAEERFEVFEVLVVGAEQGFDPLFGDGDAFHRPVLGFIFRPYGLIFKCSSSSWR